MLEGKCSIMLFSISFLVQADRQACIVAKPVPNTAWLIDMILIATSRMVNLKELLC